MKSFFSGEAGELEQIFRQSSCESPLTKRIKKEIAKFPKGTSAAEMQKKSKFLYDWLLLEELEEML